MQKTEITVRMFNVLSPSADEKCKSYAMALIDVKRGIGWECFQIDYSKDQSHDDGSPDIGKIDFGLPQIQSLTDTVVVCAFELKSRGKLPEYIAVVAKSGDGGKFGACVEGWEFLRNDTQFCEAHNLDFERLENEADSTEIGEVLFAKYLMDLVLEIVKNEGLFSENWYLANILGIYFSGGHSNTSFAFRIGDLYARLCAKQAVEEKIQSSEERLAKSGKNGGKSSAKARLNRLNELLSAWCECGQAMGRIERNAEMSLRKVVIERLMQSSDFPKTRKTHTNYFATLTSEPEFKSTYESVFK